MGPFYYIDNGTLKSFKIENDLLMRKKQVVCDMHCHSKYSGREPDLFIATPPTMLLGVRECYSNPKKMFQILRKKGATFSTISDHNSVLGALEQRREYPEDCYISCEYTVEIEKGNGSAIHSLVCGIDYPGNISKPLQDKEVLKLHQELLRVAEEGHLSYAKFCEEVFPKRYVLAHPCSQVTPKVPIDGAMLDDLTDIFPVLEINGDYQNENILTFLIALEKNKPLITGTDAHTTLRLGNQFTITKDLVSTPYEFLQAVAKREVGIGSRMQMPPKIMENYSSETTLEEKIRDIVKYQFNGRKRDLQKDTYMGVWDYGTKEWSMRKSLGLVGLVGIHCTLGALLGPEYTLPTLLAIEGSALFLISSGIPIGEKMVLARRAKSLYESYQEHCFHKKTRSLREEIKEREEEIRDRTEEIEKRKKLMEEIKQEYNKPLLEVMAPLKGFSKFLHWLIGCRNIFKSDYEGGRIKR